MEKNYTIGEYVFTIKVNEIGMRFTMINRMLCEEYTLILNDNDPIFSCHCVINCIKKLGVMLCDAFEKKNDKIEISYQPIKPIKQSSDSKDELSYVLFSIKFDAVYVTDLLELKLPFIEKHITPSQVIDRIDYRFDQLSPRINEQFEKMTTMINESFEQRDSIIQRISSESVANATLITELREHVNDISRNKHDVYMAMEDLKKSINVISEQSDAFHTEFLEYVQSKPIMCTQERVDRIRHGESNRCINKTSIVMYNAQSININYINQQYCFDDNPYIDFSVNKFKYLLHLQTIEFSSCPFPNLDFLAITQSLKKITLNTMDSLVSIEHIAKYPNLSHIRISGICKIKDLYTLTDCKNLKLLELPNGTNTGIFPKNIDFEIKMI